jgi:hypothetical protein
MNGRKWDGNTGSQKQMAIPDHKNKWQYQITKTKWQHG